MKFNKVYVQNTFNIVLSFSIKPFFEFPVNIIKPKLKTIMKIKKTLKLILPMIMGAMVIASCSSDDDSGTVPPIVDPGDSTTY